MIFVKILVLFFCILGIIITLKNKNNYKADGKKKEEIIKYFEDKKAFTIETGIYIKDLPLEISKSNFLLFMVKDKILLFKKGKYYLNKKEKSEENL